MGRMEQSSLSLGTFVAMSLLSKTRGTAQSRVAGETLGCSWMRWAVFQWCLSQTSPCQESSSCVRQACRGTKGRLRQRCALTRAGCEKPPCPQKGTFTSTQTAPTGRSACGPAAVLEGGGWRQTMGSALWAVAPHGSTGPAAAAPLQVRTASCQACAPPCPPWGAEALLQYWKSAGEGGRFNLT